MLIHGILWQLFFNICKSISTKLIHMKMDTSTRSAHLFCSFSPCAVINLINILFLCRIFFPLLNYIRQANRTILYKIQMKCKVFTYIFILYKWKKASAPCRVHLLSSLVEWLSAILLMRYCLSTWILFFCLSFSPCVFFSRFTSIYSFDYDFFLVSVIFCILCVLYFAWTWF